MIGTTLSRYRITAKLGEGGMGSVWLAEDSLLGRAVALKLLAPHLAASEVARQRFVREARAASHLAHPGIATVFDAGEAGGHVFIAYQYIEGDTLAHRLAAGPLPLPDLLRLARGAAEALAHAHGRDVLHRDLTAGNIMLGPGGLPVIVDFGLARMHGDVTLTSTGITLGTAPYLAAEQWRGEPGDARADLWSLGVVLYYAATGQQPFGSDAPEAVMYRVLNEEPAKPTKLRAELPAEFERLVLRLLEKDAQDRLASATELATALQAIAGEGQLAAADPLSGEAPAARVRRWWRKLARRKFGPAQVAMVTLAVVAMIAVVVVLQQRLLPTRLRVLAVLPMRNTSSDIEGTAHLGEALGEELVRRLGLSRAFRLLPWVTTVRYGSAQQSPSELAKLLHVDMLLMGSYRSEGDQLQVHAELIDGKSGMQSWSERYTHPESELITLQSELAAAVSQRMDPGFSRAERQRLAASAPTNPEAYRYFILGSSYWHSGDPATLPLVEPFFQKAVELDSTLAVAWVGLGAVLVDRVYRGEGGGGPELARADDMFRRALALHPGLPAAERGLIRTANEMESGDGAQSAREFAARALERNANDVDELQTAIWGFNFGMFPELALPPINRALTLDPNNQGVRFHQVMSLCWSAKPMRCLAAGAEYIRRFGEDLEVYGYMSESAFALGRHDDAILLGRRALELNGNAPAHQSIYQLAGVYLAVGDSASFRALLGRWVPELEARFRAQPDDRRIEISLRELYKLAGDEQSLRDVMARVTFEPRPRLEWSALARFGDTKAALAVIRTLDTTWSSTGIALPESLGLPVQRGNPRVDAVRRSPEYQTYQAAIDRLNLAVFGRLRDIVARYFSDDPDLPKPRTRWPRNPPQ